MAGFDSIHYRQVFLLNPGMNDAVAYGVTKHYCQSSPGSFRYIGIHHLTPSENVGNHHVFLDILDEQGKRLTNMQIAYTWEGNRPDEVAPNVAMDKPAEEAGGNIGLGMGQIVTVWVDAPASDRVAGLSTMHPDETEAGMEYAGNTLGHHSFYVVFQRYGAAPTPTPVPTGDCAVYIARIKQLEAALTDAQSTMLQLIARISKVK
jgi:hypothetical protein